MYIKEILYYLLWPAMIVGSVYLIRWTLSRYEKEYGEDDNANT